MCFRGSLQLFDLPVCLLVTGLPNMIVLPERMMGDGETI